MSDRIEERRQAEVHDQKRMQAEKSQKEKDASALKFKQSFSQKGAAEQKNAGLQKQAGQQKQFNQSLLAAKQGIATRSNAEKLMQSRDDAGKADKELTGAREKDLSNDREGAEMNASDDRVDAQTQAAQQQQFDAPIKNEEQNKGEQQQGQGQQHPGQGQGGNQQPSGQQQKDKDKDDGSIGGLKSAQRAGGPGGAEKSEGAQNAGKVAIGKTMRAAAAERIPQPVMQALVDKVAVMAMQGMQEFQIQMKDDALGGGTLRVTIDKNKKLKIAFTMKDQSAKNLLDSSKGVLMRMFERKGIMLESFEVKMRGEG